MNAGTRSEERIIPLGEVIQYLIEISYLFKLINSLEMLIQLRRKFYLTHYVIVI